MFSANTSQVAAGGGALYVEDVMSTFLYSATGATQNIVNNIDLSTKGGLVWIKDTTLAYNNCLFDTSRGTGKTLYSNTTNAQVTDTASLTNFNTNGFTLGADSTYGYVNNAGNLVSWSFAKAPKFFDVVTYTGNGTTQTLSHNLGSAPGFIIVKAVSGATAGIQRWTCYHQSLGASYAIWLNLSDASFNMGAGVWGNNTTTVTPSSTTFTVGADDWVNSASNTYVAYLFAHNAGGFGLTGTDNVISCGSFTTTAGGAYSEVSLGYEPQWVLIKTTSTTNDWMLFDNMRGMTASLGGGALLTPNSSAQEFGGYSRVIPTATGFYGASGLNASADYIYIAIRRGPMKVPTSGTDVFQPVKFISTASRQTVGSLPAVDMFFGKRMGSLTNWGMSPRLTALFLKPNLTDAQDSSVTGYGDSAQFDLQNGSSFITAGSGDEFVTYNLRRSPSYFDVVCYTGTGSSRSQAHNLGVAPELMIFKSRDASNWNVFFNFGASFSSANLNSDGIANTNSYGSQLTSAPTATDINLGASFPNSVEPMIAYLFATCAGVSKVGTYTGTGTTLQINCGFTSGARFVLIRRTSASSSDWYVWDSARGIVAGNDPYLLLNSTAREVTNTDYVDTYSAGFEISSTAPAAINGSGGTFLFLAIA